MLAAVISEGGSRFARARKVLEHAGFRVIHLPAVFANTRNSGVAGHCKGFNGLRLATRNAWSLIASTNTSMAIVEDDIALHKKIATQSSASVTRQLCRYLRLSREAGFTLAYLGQLQAGRYVRWGTHAIWTTPAAARLLLSETTQCYTKVDEGTDTTVVGACRSGRLTCRYAWLDFQTGQSFGGRHGFFGFFVQDRLNVSSYLHTKTNKPTRLKDVVPKGVWQQQQ